jgi:putative toxin-antitoxin system antitoxin component (TIGR02293 family)
MRSAELLDMAVRVFGDSQEASRWMRKPKYQFSGRTPYDMMVTESGAQAVEDLLGTIEQGRFA